MSLQELSFVVLDPSTSLTKALEAALDEHVPAAIRDRIRVINRKLSDLEPPDSHFDCIVSPANSYGRLDGGFDYIISRALAPKDDIDAVTRIAQSVLYSRWKGYAPPGSCTMVPLADTVCEVNQHQCAFIALVPTMRVPEVVTWNREIVYNCVWSLVNALTQHNASLVNEPAGGRGVGKTRIRTVLMTGLGTGVGFIPPERFAKQTALAFQHFWDSESHPEKWSSLQWPDADGYSREVAGTLSKQLRDFEHTTFSMNSSRSLLRSFLVLTSVVIIGFFCVRSLYQSV